MFRRRGVVSCFIMKDSLVGFKAEDWFGLFKMRRGGTRPLIQRSPVRFRARSHTGVMDYDEACFMHLTPGVVHNFSKAVGV